jgi:hypothetical protein
VTAPTNANVLTHFPPEPFDLVIFLDDYHASGLPKTPYL